LGAVIGAVNWALHCKVGIPAFIATMGTSLFIQGILMGLTSSARVFSTKWPENFRTLGTGRLFDTISNRRIWNRIKQTPCSKWPENFRTLGTGRLFDTIPYPAICFLILSVVLLFFTEGTN